ncbi:MAG: DUF29 domain-containing protein [Pseudomonadota bacterium]|nr:DUF29 domain-containing protein [Pseudomonadota bacterium]
MGDAAKSYDQDFYAWALENARLIREGRFAEMDAARVAEEIEAMGRHIKRALEHRLAVLLAHLLEWAYQPDFRSKSWSYTIIEQRFAIADLLAENPSLKTLLPAAMPRAYRRALRLAAAETEQKITAFPSHCPWPFGQCMDDDFWPD